MTLRRRFVLYLIVLHLILAALGWAVIRPWPPLLLLLEASLALLLVSGLLLVRSLLHPLALLGGAADLLGDGEFTTRLREVRQPEMDRLIRVYNRMVENLRAERVRLQEKHYFLEKVLTASPSGVITLDYDGRIAVINPSAESELGRDVLGRKLEELHLPFADALARLGQGESLVIPLRGSRRMKCQRARFVDEGHERSFILMEELTEELRRSEKAAYEKLLRLMSHEVNNSVGAAGSLLQSCLNYSHHLPGEDRRDYTTALNVVISRLDSLNAFVKSFADVVRVPPPELRPCDIRDLLEEVVAVMRAELDRRRVTCLWDLDGAPEAIRLDRVQMEQVFVNVIKNAMEAIGENGVITIRAGRRGGRPFVAVEDSGPGIGPEVASHLFRPFFSTRRDGRGVGLTLVQEILTQHRLEFSLESQPGQPTRFTIQFP